MTTGSRLTADGTHTAMTRTFVLEAVVLAVFAMLWLIVETAADHDLIMHALIAQLGALLGWKEREGRGIVAQTPSAARMIAFILTYLIAAVVVSTIPTTAALAIGPVALLVDRSAPLVDRTAPEAAPSA